MAATGFTPISLYYSTTASAVPLAANLANGELGLNTADMKLYSKNSAGVVTLLASSGGATGTVSSVAATVPAFLSVTGSPITTSGTLAITLSGTALPVANGGTGQTTANAAFNALVPSQTSQAGKYLTTDGTNTSWGTNPLGTVTSVGQSFTGGLISVAGSPVTTSGTLALTVAGTSGGIPYFSSASTWATSAALAASSLVVGGGAGAAPATVTTGTGVVTALGVAVGTAGSFVVNGGVLGTPSSGTLTNCTFPTLNQSTTGNAATATVLQTARTLWGQSFNGSANITGALSSVTTIGMSGQLTNTLAIGTAPMVITSTTRVANLNVATAGTADTLTTARTINGVSFNGSANITVTANTTNTLTLGTYLTGTSFNGSAAVTAAVDATSANTASKVVARDASGNFSAGTITATLSGNASTATSATTATNLAGGAVGSIAYQSGVGATTFLADVATGNAVISGGVGVAPSYGKIGLTTHVSGTLPVANGGTGLSSTPANGALDIGNGTGFTRTTLSPGTGISITNGAGTITIASTGGSSFSVKTANYTAVTGDNLLANTSAGSFTITLPATPTAGNTVYIQDSSGTFGITPLTVGRNGSTIMGLAEDMVASTNNVGFGLTYNGSDWRIY